jgi:hypothetical protein
MKTLKIILSIIIIGFFISCQKDNINDLNKRTTRQVEDPNQLSGKWTLVNITGGIPGSNISFPQGWITWEFNETNHSLNVINNNLYGNPAYSGLQTGVYSFTNNITPSNCENNFQSIEIVDVFYGCYSITNNVLIIKNAQIADGLQYTLIRVQNCHSNYIVFGHYYGFCGGETCIEKFKLTSDKIYEDISDVYPGTFPLTPPNYVQLSDQKFLLAQDLMSFFPNELLAETSPYIGMPDATDGGGLYIEYHFNGVHKTWLIDQFKENVPITYHAFMDKVNEKIAVMQ